MYDWIVEGHSRAKGQVLILRSQRIHLQLVHTASSSSFFVRLNGAFSLLLLHVCSLSDLHSPILQPVQLPRLTPFHRQQRNIRALPLLLENKVSLSSQAFYLQYHRLQGYSFLSSLLGSSRTLSRTLDLIPSKRLLKSKVMPKRGIFGSTSSLSDSTQDTFS